MSTSLNRKKARSSGRWLMIGGGCLLTLASVFMAVAIVILAMSYRSIAASQTAPTPAGMATEIASSTKWIWAAELTCVLGCVLLGVGLVLRYRRPRKTGAEQDSADETTQLDEMSDPEM